MSQRIVEVSREYDRSKGFLFGLYVGLLSLLILVSLGDPFHPILVSLGDPFKPNVPVIEYIYDKPGLHTATNIYGILALAGAVLGFWRIWKWADKPRKLLFLPSVWICVGLAVWAVAEGLWVLDGGDDPGLHDIAFILADLFWLMALGTIFKLVNKLLEGLKNPEIRITPFMGLVTTVLTLLVGVFVWTKHPLIQAQTRNSKDLFKLGIDGIYILLTFASMILAVALVNGKTAQLPLPVQRCLRYLFAATVINAIATIAFVVMKDLPKTDPWKYSDGNWIDWLFLTVMYCWGISALKCPIRATEHRYTYSTTLDDVSIGDFYQAREIAQHCLQTEPNSRRTIYLDSDSTRWIVDNIQGCWNIVKLGELVVGSTFLFPVSRALTKRLDAREITEREMFEEVKNNPLTWECLYLADASILAHHRRRKLAFNCFKKTIDQVRAQHNPKIDLHCWPNSLERDGLVDKLEAHFEEKVKVTRVPVVIKRGLGD